MRFKWTPAILLLASTGLCSSTPAVSQTSVAASVYGAFTQSTTGNSTKQSPSNAPGVLLELQHISNPLVGYEFTYSYNRANQDYSLVPPCTANETCTATAAIKAAAHEITGDWIVSVKLANLRPFALAGIGVLLNEPSGGTITYTSCGTVNNVCTHSTSTASTSTSTKPVFVYGAGLDWTLLPHLGLRFQYRGNLYKAPDMLKAFSSTDSFTRTSEPMAGIFLRF